MTTSHASLKSLLEIRTRTCRPLGENAMPDSSVSRCPLPVSRATHVAFPVATSITTAFWRLCVSPTFVRICWVSTKPV